MTLRILDPRTPADWIWRFASHFPMALAIFHGLLPLAALATLVITGLSLDAGNRQASHA